MPKLELEKLKSSIVAMGEMCEFIVANAMTSLIDRDVELATKTKEYDDQIDEMELNIDRQCRNLLLCGKLDKENTNFVLSTHKINNDLERIGDNAVHISEHVHYLVREKSILTDIIDFLPMFEQVGEMIGEGVNALLEGDTKLAWKIVDEQLIVHDNMRAIFAEIVEIMKHNPATIERSCHILFINDFPGVAAGGGPRGQHRGSGGFHRRRQNHPPSSRRIPPGGRACQSRGTRRRGKRGGQRRRRNSADVDRKIRQQGNGNALYRQRNPEEKSAGTLETH